MIIRHGAEERPAESRIAPIPAAECYGSTEIVNTRRTDGGAYLLVVDNGRHERHVV